VASRLDGLHEQPLAGHALGRDLDHHVAALAGVGPFQLGIGGHEALGDDLGIGAHVAFHAGRGDGVARELDAGGTTAFD
jgi:hypothetical protein